MWTSAQALVALLRSRQTEPTEPLRAAFDFIEESRLDGSRVGWTYTLGSDEPTVTEVAAWVLLALAAGLDAGLWDADGAERVRDRIARDVAALVARQHASGGFAPVDLVVPANLRTYSSLMALWALAECRHHLPPEATAGPAQRVGAWLLRTRREGLGWVVAPDRPRQRERYPGLAAQALVAMAVGEQRFADGQAFKLVTLDKEYREIQAAFASDAALVGRDLVDNDHVGERDQSLVGTTFRIEGSSFLWCTWSLWALELLRNEPALPAAARAAAAASLPRLLEKLLAGSEQVGYGGTWEVAETLLCVSRLKL